MTVEVITESRCFGGWWTRVRHESSACNAAIGFSVFQPPKAASGPVPALYWLPGYADGYVELQIRLMASYWLSKLGFAFVIPDTRPDLDIYRTTNGGRPLDWNTAWYVNANLGPFRHHHRMFDYVALELVDVVPKHFPIDASIRSIAGHATGGLAALCIGLRKQSKFRTISAVAPSQLYDVSRHRSAELTTLLGAEGTEWKLLDPVHCARRHTSKNTIRIDFGIEGDGYNKSEVERLMRGLQSAGQPVDMRTHRSYQNGAHLVASFLDQHLEHHALALGVRESKIYETLGLL